MFFLDMVVNRRVDGKFLVAFECDDPDTGGVVVESSPFFRSRRSTEYLDRKVSYLRVPW